MKSIASVLIACAAAVALEPTFDKESMDKLIDAELPLAECSGCCGGY
jgi:hypothetical protein